MRMRYKPWVRPELNMCEYYIKNPEEFKGKWNEFLKNKTNEEKPIYLELGCGKGSFISKFAVNNPNINFIAIDIKSEMLGLAKRKIDLEYKEHNLEINNIVIMSYQILLIDKIFNENDKISRIYINFCNPWPKEKHKKRRLTHTRQLENYKKFLVNNGEIWFKTDDDNLFEESLEYFKESGFDVIYKTYDLHNSEYDKDNIRTEHENMFTEKGIKIKFLIAKRK